MSRKTIICVQCDIDLEESEVGEDMKCPHCGAHVTPFVVGSVEEFRELYKVKGDESL
ncbi:MAG: hypothetical protein AAB632_01120 [Patescibacteria group bacterium]